MKIPTCDKKFVIAPEYKGPAVCADVSEPKEYETPYGPKQKIKVVFELPILRDDGTPFAVWSKPMTPSSHERSAFAQFIKDWFGKAPTKEEWERFDTEDLVGRGAEIVVIHEHVNGETYANIKLIMPDKSGETMKLSGKFVRAKDRPAKEGGGNGQQSGYRRVEQPLSDHSDLGATKVHVGACRGLELRDLSVSQVRRIVEQWLPVAKQKATPTADDKRLIAALEWWQSRQRAAEDDNIPY